MLYLNTRKTSLGSRALGWGAMALGLTLGSLAGCGESRCDAYFFPSTSVQLEASDGWVEGAVYRLQVTDADLPSWQTVECVFRWSEGEQFSCQNYQLDTTGGVARLDLWDRGYQRVDVVLSSGDTTLVDASLPSDGSTHDTCAGSVSSYSVELSFDHSSVDGTLPSIPLCLECHDGYARGEVSVSCFCSVHDCPESQDDAQIPRPGERVEVASCDGVDLVSWPDADNPMTLAYAGNTLRDVHIELASAECLEQPYELSSTGFPDPGGCDEFCVVSAGMKVAERGACLTEQDVEEGLSSSDPEGVGGATGL